MENTKPFLNQVTNILQLLREKEPVVERPTKTNSDFNSYIVKGIYSDSELDRFYKQRSNSTYAGTQNQTSILLQYLKLISNNTKNSEEKTKDLIALNPEIRKAKQIYVSSVMSPNDLQDQLIKITIDDESMELNLKTKVEEYLNDFFNVKHDFGTKLSTWIGEYTYEQDAKPIMILPKSNINDLIEYHKKLEKNNGHYAIFTEEEHVCFKKSTFNEKTKKEALTTKIFKEAWEVFEPMLDKNNQIIGKKLIKEGADSTIKFIQNNSDVINFTTDVAKMAKLGEANKYRKEIKDNDILKRMFDTYQGFDTNILMISDKFDERNVQPVVLELPAKAVIPIIIPGSKTEHIGYFVLMDEWGNPISIFDSYNQFDNNVAMSKKANQAIFNTGNPIFHNVFTNDPNYRYEATQSIFNIAIKHILEDKFKKNQMLDLPLDEYEGLSKFLFHQMLNQNRTTVLFVPENLIVYYCDNYKEDGTGQSKIGLVDFVLSLRTTLLVAGVMGAIRAAIDKEIIEVTIDPKNTNPEQTIDMIRNAAIEKKALNFTSTNPSLISRSITDAAISIVPKNFKGLDFELTKSKDTTASDYRQADDGLMETLSNMFIDQLGVPPSSLNKLSEEEFAKSVTTNNILFSNEIRKVQKLLKPKNKKYLSTYLKFSLNNQKELVKIFDQFGDGKKKADIKTDDESGLSDQDESPIFNPEQAKFLHSVISNIEANLPAPNIAVTKSHLEDLQAELEFINLVLETIYNEDTIYTERPELKDFLKTMLANIRADKFKQILENSTFHKDIIFEDLDKFDLKTIADKMKTIMNKYQGIKTLETAITNAMESGGGEGGDDGGVPGAEPTDAPADDSFDF